MALSGEPRPVLRELGLGTAVGLMSGLFGVGGGTVAVPGLVWLGFAQHAAHATSLAAIVLIATAALVPFWLDGAVQPVAALVLLAGALCGAYAGAGLMHRVPERWLRLVFVVVVAVVAARMLVGVEPAAGQAPPLGLPALVALVGVGLATGVLSAVLGLGGGLVLVPALVLAFGFSQHAAEGTSLAVIIPTALVGAARHTRHGYTRWGTGLTVGLGGIAGGVAGAAVALSLDGLVLQRLFAVFLVAITVRLLLRPRGDVPAEGEVP